MAHHVETTLRVSAPAQKVWETLADFSSIERFSSKVDSSPIVGENSSGLGAQRKCTFYDKSTVVEEIVEYNEGESFRIELSEYAMPLKSLMAQMKVTPVDDTCSDVSFSMDYVVKFGPVGWLMGQLMMKPMMRGVTKDVLRGLAFHVVTGNRVGPKLPSSTDLAPALA
jgi:ribosome-associated toxin RatA of RatAB toxin-antitoxin module